VKREGERNLCNADAMNWGMMCWPGMRSRIGSFECCGDNFDIEIAWLESMTSQDRLWAKS